MKRSVRLIESERISAPVAFGLFRPSVGLPVGFQDNFSAAQQEAVLAHELAHLAAHDPAWLLLADGLTALLWWHPLVWSARRELQATSEAAADEASLLVKDGPAALAECLVTFGQQLSGKKNYGWLNIEGNGFRSGLGRRVQRLLNLGSATWRPPHSFRTALVKALGPVVLVVAAILTTAWANPQSLPNKDMKTLIQTWTKSLTQLALVTTIVGLNANQQTSPAAFSDNPAAPAVPAALAATEPPAVDTDPPAQNTPRTYKPASPSDSPHSSPNKIKPAQGDSSRPFYMMDRKLMERYGLIPPSGPAATASARPTARRDKKALDQKLEEIILDEVTFDALPLSEVLKFLYEQSRKLDPEERGVNFLISNAGPAPASGAVDPNTGAPLPPSEPIDMSSVIIRFTLPLRNVRLKDVLDAIVKVADQPTKYSVEEYGVVFLRNPDLPAQEGYGAVYAPSPMAAPPEPMGVRTFRIDRQQLSAGLESAFGISINTSTPATALDQKKKEIQLRWAERELEELEKKHAVGVGERAQLEEARTAVEMLKASNDRERLEAQLRGIERKIQALSVMVDNGRGQRSELNKAEAEKELIQLELAELEKKGAGKAVRFTQTRDLVAGLRQLFGQLGVNFEGQGKGLFYNEKSGLLMVRAGLSDLEVIQAAIETLGGQIGRSSDLGPGGGGGFGGGFGGRLDAPASFGMAGAGFGGGRLGGDGGIAPGRASSGIGGGAGGLGGSASGTLAAPSISGSGGGVGNSASGTLAAPSAGIAAEEKSLPSTTRKVAVLGEVNRPGLYDLPENGTLPIIEAIAAAGGVTKIAQESKIEHIHGGKTSVFTFNDLRKHTGTPEAPKVEAGDVVYVHEKFL